MPRRKSDDKALVFSRREQRSIVIEALKILPNVSLVYRHLGELIGVSYGTVWNIAKAEGVKLIRFDPRRLKHSARVSGPQKRGYGKSLAEAA